MENRIAILSVIIDNLSSSEAVNSLLHEYNNIIVGRMGIPYRERGISVMAVVVDTDADIISAITGKLGKIPGVSVKSAISKNK